MELFDTTQVLLERAMAGSAIRHAALSNNLANVNTPGYRRRDVDFHGTLQAAMRSGRRAAVEGSTFEAAAAAGGAVRADGNTVDPDAEAAALAKNGLEYEAFVQVSRARIDILKSAMGAA